MLTSGPVEAATPSISILVVTLNERDNLPGLFASLRAQTDRRFDLVIVDGKSTDGSYEMIGAATDIVTSHVSEEDFGFYDALNRGVRRLKTDFYLVLGADDRLEPDAVANFRAAAVLADIVVAQVDAGGDLRQGYHPRNAWIGPSRTFTSHSVGTLIRTSLHTKLGLYSFRYPTLADWHFLKKAFASKGVHVAQADFIAGFFNTAGLSNQNFVRTLCELWLVQRETGESPLIQCLLFQARLIKNLVRATR